MTRAIQDAGWALPATVAWNGTDLPFAYPPLAFYKVGLLNACSASTCSTCSAGSRSS